MAKNNTDKNQKETKTTKPSKGKKKPLVPAGSPPAGEVIRLETPDGLSAWFRLYGSAEASANAQNTFKAKSRDLKLFVEFFSEQVRSDHPDDWTKPVTQAFLRRLENTKRMKPTSINRILSTLRHVAGWMHRHRAFLAGNPTDGIKELVIDEPVWKGLSDVEVMRLKSASEQLVTLKRRKNQNPLRDRAVFMVLLHTGLRVSELLALRLDQYDGKSFRDVKRKGKIRTAKVFVPPDAREVLDLYLDSERGREAGAIFQSRSGQGIARQHVDRLLEQLAAQANSKLPQTEKISLSAHVLRHTFLRKVTDKHGVEFAMEAAGHSSSKYIWRYVKPSQEEKEKALENLF